MLRCIEKIRRKSTRAVEKSDDSPRDVQKSRQFALEKDRRGGEWGRRGRKWMTTRRFQPRARRRARRAMAPATADQSSTAAGSGTFSVGGSVVGGVEPPGAP